MAAATCSSAAPPVLQELPPPQQHLLLILTVASLLLAVVCRFIPCVTTVWPLPVRAVRLMCQCLALMVVRCLWWWSGHTSMRAAPDSSRRTRAPATPAPATPVAPEPQPASAGTAAPCRPQQQQQRQHPEPEPVPVPPQTPPAPPSSPPPPSARPVSAGSALPASSTSSSSGRSAALSVSIPRWADAAVQVTPSGGCTCSAAAANSGLGRCLAPAPKEAGSGGSSVLPAQPDTGGSSDDAACTNSSSTPGRRGGAARVRFGPLPPSKQVWLQQLAEMPPERKERLLERLANTQRRLWWLWRQRTRRQLEQQQQQHKATLAKRHSLSWVSDDPPQEHQGSPVKKQVVCMLLQ